MYFVVWTHSHSSVFSHLHHQNTWKHFHVVPERAHLDAPTLRFPTQLRMSERSQAGEKTFNCSPAAFLYSNALTFITAESNVAVRSLIRSGENPSRPNRPQPRSHLGRIGPLKEFTYQRNLRIYVSFEKFDRHSSFTDAGHQMLVISFEMTLNNILSYHPCGRSRNDGTGGGTDIHCLTVYDRHGGSEKFVSNSPNSRSSIKPFCFHKLSRSAECRRT